MFLTPFFFRFEFLKVVKTASVLWVGAWLLSACASQSEIYGATQCEGGATYSAVFNSTWSPETHPTDFPDQAHFSELIGATHNSEVSFWSVGQKASAGIKDVSELGINRKFIKEVKWAMKIGEAGSVVHGSDIKVASGLAEVQFQANSKYSLLTLMTMIAPSPDWFVGISGLKLCENGTWVSNKTISLKVYDAGTDDGARYMAENKVTMPKEAITELRSGMHNENGVIPQFATLSLKLTSLIQ